MCSVQLVKEQFGHVLTPHTLVLPSDIFSMELSSGQTDSTLGARNEGNPDPDSEAGSMVRADATAAPVCKQCVKEGSAGSYSRSSFLQALAAGGPEPSSLSIGMAYFLVGVNSPISTLLLLNVTNFMSNDFNTGLFSRILMLN